MDKIIEGSTSMVKFILAFLLIVLGIGIAAVGFFFYFVGGICGTPPDALAIGISGIVTITVGAILLILSYNSRKPVTGSGTVRVPMTTDK